MAFPNNKNRQSPEASKPARGPKAYKKIGSMWNSTRFEGHTMSFDDYSGDLLFQDKETGKFYKVKGASLFNPKDGAPENLVYNLLIDLNNPYDVSEIQDEGGEAEGDRQD